ncbi:hypothetical protein EYF80_012539 [Liparis tanakae]|uniref:Uncharacterized protein n=1 Tax=Liparis tanakae TaxID=230148 RepID=A0A4Z2IIY4_9TELE|nr:hypothetical protein EYF80_012539 [Liparis tanakae]
MSSQTMPLLLLLLEEENPELGHPAERSASRETMKRCSDVKEEEEEDTSINKISPLRALHHRCMLTTQNMHRRTLQTDSADALCRRTLQTLSADGLCRRTLQTLSADALCRRTLQTLSADGLCRRTLQMHSADSLCRRTLQTHSADALCRRTLQTQLSADAALCRRSLQTQLSADDHDRLLRSQRWDHNEIDSSLQSAL